MLCDDLGGQGGDGGGREAQKGGNTCIVMTNSQCCSAETNTAL